MSNRRRYLRISTVLPVEFFIIDSQGRRITPWLQGFTRDIGKGGICLIVNELWRGFYDKLRSPGARISLRVNFPFIAKPVCLEAKVSWLRSKGEDDFIQYLAGLDFLDIDKSASNRIFKYAVVKKSIPFSVSLAGFVLVAVALSLFWHNFSLTKANQKLVSDYVEVLERTSALEELLSEGVESSAKSDIKKEVASLDKERIGFSSQIIKGMYSWIKNRQDLSRGLVLSFEGDNSLKRVCFTYDQSLAAIIFLVRGDTERAEKILNFYLDKINTDKLIYNAYFTRGGVFEYVQHSGPNAWIGLAALCYTKHTGNRKYLPIIETVSRFLIKMMDKEAGIKGGPEVSWYSTEHNLDAFAFFRLFYELSGDVRYRDIAEGIKNWVARYAYSDYGQPVKRGKGDSTIATDTYTWSVSSFGPEALYSLGMNPEAILDFAIENCQVSVEFQYKERVSKLTGFDFAKAKHIARGGVVSGEWTSQMILAFEIMADYFKDKDPEKSKEYLKKAYFYFNELQKMLITSPSLVGREDPCLPYASSPGADTGHGWRTPRGGRTGSLASTAYFLLAYEGYNPLAADFLELSLKSIYQGKPE